MRSYLPSDEHVHCAVLVVEGIEYIKEKAIHEDKRGNKSFLVPVLWTGPGWDLGDDQSVLNENDKASLNAALVPLRRVMFILSVFMEIIGG